MLLARWPKRQRCRASLSRSRRPSPRWRLSKGRAPRHPLGRARRFDPVGLIAFTSDITLASRCVKSGADVIAPTGKRFSESSIGMALATRNLMDDLRRISDIGAQCLWPPRPFEFPQCARQRGRAATAFGDDALLMTPIGVERRAERHAGARAVRGPAPSFFLVALMERYGTTVSVTACRRGRLRSTAVPREPLFQALSLRPGLVRLAAPSPSV